MKLDLLDLFERIQASGLKQKFIAKKIGITRNYLWYILKGKRNPSPEVIERLLTLIKKAS